jgi:hypothetical protein
MRISGICHHFFLVFILSFFCFCYSSNRWICFKTWLFHFSMLAIYCTVPLKFSKWGNTSFLFLIYASHRSSSDMILIIIKGLMRHGAPGVGRLCFRLIQIKHNRGLIVKAFCSFFWWRFRCITSSILSRRWLLMYSLSGCRFKYFGSGTLIWRVRIKVLWLRTLSRI